MPSFCRAALISALAAATLATALPAAAQATAPAAPRTAAPGSVVVSGTVPDEATRQAILARVREVYGADRVVDQLGVGNLVAPPNWTQQVQKLITPDLKQISQGELRINGSVVDVLGRVDNAARQQQLVSEMVTRLGNSTYTVRNGLRVGTPGQEQLDAALADRIVEFKPGNAELTPAGMQILDDLVPLLQQFTGRRFEVVGHTDSDGLRENNLALSLARAEAVKRYLVSRGIAPAAIQTQGYGPDRPVADNDTADGRARNRRIEFRVLA